MLRRTAPPACPWRTSPFRLDNDTFALSLSERDGATFPWASNLAQVVTAMVDRRFNKITEIRTSQQMSRNPLLGHLFENLVVMEALKSRWNQGVDPDLYHIRDSGGFEIDQALSRQRQLFPVEIKAARSYCAAFFKNLEKSAHWSESIQPGAVIYAGEEEQVVHGHWLLPFTKTNSWFQPGSSR